jgi:hypothetical protein
MVQWYMLLLIMHEVNDNHSNHFITIKNVLGVFIQCSFHPQMPGKCVLGLKF